MTLDDIKSVYFVGAGGIGMSTLERYFLAEGKRVAGYDRTSCELTETLCKEGADIHYEDSVELIPECCRDKAATLVYIRLPSRQTTKNWPISATTVSRCRNVLRCSVF